MSRCFPFPPPGYVLNGIRDESLIESIKRAEEKAKKELRKKDRKREKKDKKDSKDKKEKKDKKRKERERGDGESEKHSHKRRCKEDVAKDGKNYQKVESENGCLEKSSLTVERDLLQSTSQNSCDSTLNTNELLPKQHKEEKLPRNNYNSNDSESIIRIRLSIRRQIDPEVVMTTTNKDQQKPCPSREMIKLDTVKSVTRDQTQQHPCSTSKPHEEKRKDHIVTTKLGKEKRLSSTSDDPSSGLCRFCPPSLAVQFLNVVENWVPNTIERRVEELTNSEDDECWWFLKKPSSHKFDGTKRCKQLNESKQVISSSMAWPCARLLPEADLHALPYTVPF
ncbi:Uncharacterized protein HA466_0130540 [Hirschfeldia incana]|nr:Uncharacterized protein HA466_0130540 [Hirschfeldia incana]